MDNIKLLILTPNRKDWHSNVGRQRQRIWHMGRAGGEVVRVREEEETVCYLDTRNHLKIEFICEICQKRLVRLVLSS